MRRPAKMLGLASLCAIASLLTLGSGTATATVLCEVELEECPAAQTLPKETAVAAKLESGTEAVFPTSLGTVKCKESTIEGNTLEEEGEPLLGEITKMTFGSCLLSSTGCTLTVEKLPFKIALTYTGEGTAELSISGIGGEPSVKVVCGALVKCTYTAKPTVKFEGAEPSRVLVKEVALLAGEGFFCPKEAKVLATYELQQPAGGNTAPAKQGGAVTKLCKSTPTENPMTGRLKCDTGEGYSGEEIRGDLEIGSATFTVVTEPTKKVTCTEAKLNGKFKEDGNFAANQGGINVLSFTSGGGACSSTLTAMNPATTVTMLNLPYSKSVIEYARVASPQGYLGFAGQNAANPIRLLLAFGINCEYKPYAFDGAITNSTSSTVTVRGQWLLKEGANCPVTLSSEAIIKFRRPLAGKPDQLAFVAGE